MYINISKVTGVKQQYYTTFSEALSAIDILINILEHEKKSTDLEINKSLDIQKFFISIGTKFSETKTSMTFSKNKKSKNCVTFVLWT